MPDQVSFPKYIFGLHEPGGEWLMEEKGKRGWIVFTHGLGRDPRDYNGYDYRPWSNRGFGIIARLNHGYGSAGTIPLPQYYDAFAQRVRNFVANSSGCHIWIIGNETNHGQERPEGQIITPGRYAACYKKCWDRIHGLPDREHDQVTVAPVAPWNNTTAYPGNETGDWVRYFSHILRSIGDLNCPVDAIALHAYTHGHEPHLIFSERRMSYPFQDRRFNFRCYQDFMGAIPQELRHLPVYITETDQNQVWENVNQGWVQNAYQEIDDWNTTPGNQQIRALVLYRWPKYDKWYIEDKTGVYDDFRAAMNHEYRWRDLAVPRQINGYTVQGPFLEFFDRWGQEHCGAPITEEIVENGLQTQYFEHLVLELAPSGRARLVAAGTEVLTLRQEVSKCRSQIDALQDRVKELEEQLREGPGGDGQQREQISDIVRPMWENIIYELPRHAVNRYNTRDLDAVEYLVINHSAVPATVTARAIANYHVNHIGWPGISYHFYIDGQGRVFQTNELTTISYHVGQWNSVSIGICVGGDFTHVVPKPAQLESAGHLSAWLLQELGLSVDAVKGKKEFIGTQSPGQQWLSGQVWKNMLRTEIEKAQDEQVRSHPLKPLYHYLLFWQSPDEWAEEEWRGAEQYIARFRVTHGFSVDEAKAARFVTIVGGTQGVDRTAERSLLDAGCQVERIAGKTTAETSAILTEMAQREQRFLSLVG
jgi:hypothetical protein